MDIINYLKVNLNIDIQTQEDLPFPIKEKTIKKNKVITDYNQIENKIYFLKSGFIQVSISINEEEKILDFIFEGNFFTAYTSVLTQKPSDVQLIALTDIEVEIIDYQDLKRSYEVSLIANKLGRYVTEWFYIHSRNREKDFLTKPVEQRYLELVSKRKDIVAIVSITKIAKYLGIHPDSLSRIRKKIIS
jgi:CRP-like cAMP-binding protein